MAEAFSAAILSLVGEVGLSAGTVAIVSYTSVIASALFYAAPAVGAPSYSVASNLVSAL